MCASMTSMVGKSTGCEAYLNLIFEGGEARLVAGDFSSGRRRSNAFD